MVEIENHENAEIEEYLYPLLPFHIDIDKSNECKRQFISH